MEERRSLATRWSPYPMVRTNLQVYPWQHWRPARDHLSYSNGLIITSPDDYDRPRLVALQGPGPATAKRTSGATGSQPPYPGLHSSHRGRRPPARRECYLATMVLLDHGPCLMIAESGATN